VDNLTESERKRGQLIRMIQSFYQEGASIPEIARIIGKDRKTVTKYLQGDPDILCRSNATGSPLDKYTDLIVHDIKSGFTQSTIAKKLKALGYEGTLTNARMYIGKVASANGLEIRKYCNGSVLYNEDGSKKAEFDYITRKGIFQYLWMDGDLTEAHRDHLWKEMPVLWEIERCIKEFRRIFTRKSIPLLHLFIDRYKSSAIKELSSFANGLEKDIDAVENSVSSDLSNGFVEGTNSKLKMVKRTMYGRCNKQLLEAKLMYHLPGRKGPNY